MKLKNNIEVTKQYYNNFKYRIIKKFTVQDRPEVKNYSKKSIYFYILEEPKDKNRFLFISFNHYEEMTLISSNTFKLNRVYNYEKFYLKLLKNKFNEMYYKIVTTNDLKNQNDNEKKHNLEINLRNICFNKLKEQNQEINKSPFFSKFKVHLKKIAIDNPNAPEQFLKSFNGLKNYKKKFKNISHKNNNYHNSIEENFISTLFIMKDNKFMLFNDHTIHLDEGKTGKSSLITSMGNKSDNISIAGLYGSSDSKNGIFRGGLIQTTKDSICVDELNELAENSKNDKILSILNSFLENGIYYYNKQFSGIIKGGNQFIFLGNITPEFNFGNLMINLMGNQLTFGRRIGIIIYNHQLKGFSAGGIINEITPFAENIKLYLSQIFNYILYETKFYLKLINHNKYFELKKYYNNVCLELIKKSENEVLRQFINSHKEDIKRQVCRSLKLYLYEHLELYLNNEKSIYDNKLCYEVLVRTKVILEENLFNLNNIVSDINNLDIDKIQVKRKLNKFKSLPKLWQNILIFLYDNGKLLTNKGTKYSLMSGKNEVKRGISKYRNGIRNPFKLNILLNQYGINLKIINNELIFYLQDKSKFNLECKFIFCVEEKNINLV